MICNDPAPILPYICDDDTMTNTRIEFGDKNLSVRQVFGTHHVAKLVLDARASKLASLVKNL